MSPLPLPLIGSLNWGDDLNAALADLDANASAAVTTALEAAADAQAAAAAAEARVVADLGTTDGQTAALIAAESSLTSTALSATYAARERQPFYVLDYLSPGRTPGTTDDTAGILAAITAAQGGTLVFHPGLYRASDVIEIDTDDVTILGDGATLILDDDGSATGRILRVRDCGNFRLRGLKIQQAAAARTGFYGLLSLSNVTDADVVSLITEGGSSTGFYCERVTGLNLVRPIISNPKADGIHISRETTNVIIDKPLITGAQDDGIGVVSVAEDVGFATYAPCRFIEINQPTVRNSTVLGSGIALVGARDVSVNGGIVDNVPAAGLIVQNANEGGVVGAERINVTGLHIVNAQGATTGGVRVASADMVSLSGLTVTDCASGGAVIIGSSRTTINGGHWVDSVGGFGVYDDGASSYTLVTGANLRGNPAGAHLLNGTGSAQSGNLV